MSSTQSFALGLQRIRGFLARWFFEHFFRLLVLAASISQWGVLCWVVPHPAGGWLWAGHLAGPAVLYSGNRWLLPRRAHRRRSQTPTGVGRRMYYAFAVTCLFGFSFLLLTGTVWVAAKVLLGAIAVEARTAHAGLAIDADLDVLFRWLADSGLALIAVAFTYGYTIGQSRLRVTRLRLPLQNWPSSLSGLRIVQISDIHIGENLDRSQLQGFVAQVNELHPDLVCITGDIIDGPAADMDGFLPVLAQLRATHGVFAILGNHDHYAGADWVLEGLQALTPFTVLRDERVGIEVNGTQLHIIGLDDRGRDWARGVTAVPYLASALATIGEREPVLLLSHRPDVFPQAAACGVALMLSGHTHGGQIAMPWFNGRVRNLAEFITAFDRGLFERNGSYLYVNCGLGVTGQRIRLCTPREITVIEVHTPAAIKRAA